MKKFFKGLALVLALVLVLGTIPASNASAKVYTKKTLYLNGGSAKKNTAKLYKLAGVKKADAAKVTAESADSKIVKAGSKKLTAKAEGKVDVKISVDGKLVTTVAVTVKDLAKPAEVELKAQSVAQTASNAIQVVFNKEVDNLTKADFNIYYKAGDAKVYGNVVNTVKQNADNKNAWDVVFFSNFQAKETYFVEVTGIELDFVAAGNSYADVTSIKIDGPATVTVNEVSKTYKLKYYNAAGMDITATVAPTAYDKFVITLSASDITDGYFTSDTIYFWTVGATATVNAKIEKLNAKYEYELVAEASMPVTCVAKAEETYANVNTWSFAAADATSFIDTWSKTNQNFAVGDSRQFQVIFNTLTGTEKGTQKVYTTGYRFESADPSIALVTSTAGTNAPVIYAVKAGETYIKISSLDQNGKVVSLITAVPISVKAARTITTVTPSWSKSNLNLTPSDPDSIKLTVNVKDQYGDPIDPDLSWQKFECKSGQTYLENLGGFDFTFTAENKVKAGQYELVLSAADLNTKIFWVKNGTYTGTLTVGDVKVGVALPVAKVNEGTPNKQIGYKLAAVNSYDTALTSQSSFAGEIVSEALKVNEIKLAETVNGYFFKNIDLYMVDAAPKKSTCPAIDMNGDKVAEIQDTGTYYVYTVTKNGSPVKINDTKNAFYDKYFKLFWNDGEVLKKADKGTYAITAYEVKVDSADLDKCSVKRLDGVTFTITDTQTAPTFTQVEGLYENAVTADAETVFTACFAPVFNGKAYKNWDKALEDGYEVVSDSVVSKVDTNNKTLVILKYNFQITNKNTSDGNNKLDELNPFIVENVTVQGIVKNK